MSDSSKGISEVARRFWCQIFWADKITIDEIETSLQVFDSYWISPLHSKSGEYGKPHYHAVYGVAPHARFNPHKTRSPYHFVLALPGTTGYASPLHGSLKSSLAYLVHYNNPEKEQFTGGIFEITTNSVEVLYSLEPAGRKSQFRDFRPEYYDKVLQPCSVHEALVAIDTLLGKGLVTRPEALALSGYWLGASVEYFGREAPFESLLQRFVESEEQARQGFLSL